MNTMLPRRNFLKAGAAATVIAGSQVMVSAPALANFAAGPALRRNASTMSANDPILRGYRTAISRMRALPDDNPCSWFYQAAIHGTTDPRNLTAWNTCHTDPRFFWAWHRMYLYWFERIVRKQSGMYDWAIPYWDWTNPAERVLPAPFRDSANILFEASRSASVNGGAPLSSGLATSVSNAFLLTDYFNAQSSINGPHGSVHVTVGGKMSSVQSAAQDPIFWVHHSQVDRLWNLWLAQGGGRSNPVGDEPWKAAKYTFFDECCQPVTMTGCEVLRAALQLSYAYEGEPAQVNQYCPRRFRIDWLQNIVWRVQRPIVIRRGVARIPFPPPPPEARELLQRVARGGEERLVLRLGGIEAAEQPGVSWEVHVGRRGFQPGERSLVGIFALFGAGIRTRRQHYHPAEFVFPIDKVARELDPGALEVLLIPVSGLEERTDLRRLAQPRVPLTIGEVAIGVDQPAKLPPQEEQDRLRREEMMQ